MTKNPPSFSVLSYASAFAAAEKYLVNAKNGYSRPIQNNTRLVRINADKIAVVLHDTAVVTYHRDGNFTIYGGGWNTVTTKQRIGAWSPMRVYSDGHGEWVVGDTGEKTPPRVTKCRSCSGRGHWMEDDWCRGPSRWGVGYCTGGRTEHRIPYDPKERNWDEHYESRYEVPCEHGQADGHPTAPCQHDQWERHTTGRSERVCYRCDGEGRCDYGSKPIPITVTSWTPFLVDADGKYLGTVDEKPTAYTEYGYSLKHDKKKSKATLVEHHTEVQYHYGSGIVDQLAALIPNIRARVKNPVTGAMDSLNTVIVVLNDTHKWSREQIADWLDTLDLDLRFPTEGGAA